jgi:hypothetical protein
MDTRELMGELAVRMGDHARGTELFTEVLAMWQPGDAFEYRAMTVADLGWIALHEGDAQRAAVQFGESLRLFWGQRVQAGMNARALVGRVQPVPGYDVMVSVFPGGPPVDSCF